MNKLINRISPETSENRILHAGFSIILMSEEITQTLSGLSSDMIIFILLSDKPFYCKIKLGSIPFAGVDPFRLLWFRQKSKTTDAQK